MASIPLNAGAIPLGNGRELRATLCIERGKQVLDLREFAPFSAAGVLMPGRNGLAVPVENIDALADLLAEAVTRAKAAGWLNEDGPS